jgi:hypothetical protein
MEKPAEEGIGVAVAGCGAWPPNKLGRCSDEVCVGGKVKKKGAGHGAGHRRKYVSRTRSRKVGLDCFDLTIPRHKKYTK